MTVHSPLPSFDRLARPYHLLECLTFGPLLRRTRERFLPSLRHSRYALVLGDGDGRFLHALLRSNPSVQALALDGSRRMLDLLSRRSRPFARRFAARQTDLRQPLPLLPDHPFDLVVTHFFLDCLSTADLHSLVDRIRPHLAPDAFWVVSEFHIPPRGLLRPVARVLVRCLYLAFRLLTGLHTARLPEHAAVLHQAGFRRVQHTPIAGGILSAELWQLQSPM